MVGKQEKAEQQLGHFNHRSSWVSLKTLHLYPAHRFTAGGPGGTTPDVAHA